MKLSPVNQTSRQPRTSPPAMDMTTSPVTNVPGNHFVARDVQRSCWQRPPVAPSTQRLFARPPARRTFNRTDNCRRHRHRCSARTPSATKLEFVCADYAKPEADLQRSGIASNNSCATPSISTIMDWIASLHCDELRSAYAHHRSTLEQPGWAEQLDQARRHKRSSSSLMVP